ncbi:uncharacterized protein (TIGR03083 family) [Arthrobacter sp. UYP6]|uniref:maleylpyruvate isomerase family mycothiol-dependent enzyme n=1 Tax=Arthrobacter sp. UYP6 TaxID=1756378 RepID=UPI00339111FC
MPDPMAPGAKTKYLDTSAPLTESIGELTAEQWAGQSACPGWSRADVVLHLIDTQREFFARHGMRLGPPPDAGNPAAAWRDHRGNVADLLSDPDVAGLRFEGWFGPTSVGSTLNDFYGFDMLVHGWDILAGTGADRVFSDSEMDELDAAIAGFGDQLYTDGICQGPLAAPANADRQTRILAQLGRRG